jgi:capsular polysaccharide export protein
MEHRAVWVAPADWTATNPLPQLNWPANPWSIATQATELWSAPDHELAAVACMTGTRLVQLNGERLEAWHGDNHALVRKLILSWEYYCPYSGTPISPADALDLLAEFRRLIESNRQFAAALGVAGWKRPTVDPLLWDGVNGPRHARHLPIVANCRSHILSWQSRTPKSLIDALHKSRFQMAEIEDGMIRGHGLGANCVPPLSVVVDTSGIYFDPSRPSDLERMLESADMGDVLLGRAARLRQRIVAEGISKYSGGAGAVRASDGKRRILVVGQVEDDRSILSGGCGQTNLELLQRTRSLEPDAWLIYRPHPDVEAGHRKGHIPDDFALHYANEIERGGSIVDLIDSIDGLHCITSLAGFEALLRGKPVTTHGVPFYAGWGLTRDMAQMPARRTRKRSLDELVAATLILYPRYIDPVTRLPCQPEIVIERMARGQAAVSAPLSGMRKLRGKLRVAARRLRETVA